MTGRVEDLSDKEKEALRLLLSGHDAKSSARELSLSFHTINDRLRNARRKLGVSSSREAARLLDEAEGCAPENLAHDDFGVAQADADLDDGDIAATKDRDDARPIWRSKGALIMSISIATIALAATMIAQTGDAPGTDARLTANAARTVVQPTPVSGAEHEMERQARSWLNLIDDGKAEESFSAAGEALRERHSNSLWELGIAIRNNNWGVPLRRDLAATELRPAENSGALGDFAVITFESEFTRRPTVIEQVTLQRINDDWVVVDYDGDDGSGDGVRIDMSE